MYSEVFEIAGCVSENLKGGPKMASQLYEMSSDCFENWCPEDLRLLISNPLSDLKILKWSANFTKFL